MFHDSNSADPSGPIVKPTDPSENGPSTGQPTDPPPTTTRTVTNFYVKGNGGVGYEGQKPNLGSISIEVWWSDGKFETFEGNTDIRAAGFTTIPAVLWEAHTNIVTGGGGVTTAAWTPITIYHSATGVTPNSTFSLKGVKAIDTTYEIGTYTSGTALISGSVAEFFEDDVIPPLTGVRVAARYQTLTGNGITTEGAAESVEFNLDASYIFTDYWHGFPSANTGGSNENPNNKRYAYGIDTSEKTGKGEASGGGGGKAGAGGTVYALISRAANITDHTKVGSTSKFVRVPLDALYNINHIEVVEYELVAKGLENNGLKYWFSDDTRFVGNDAYLNSAGAIVAGARGSNVGLSNNIFEYGKTTAQLNGRDYWEAVIKNSTVSFDVYYMGVDDTQTKNRDKDMLTRAFELTNARVESIPNFRVFEDDPTAVTLRLGYYGWDYLQATNVPTKEQWLNYLNFQIPIARFTEAIRIDRQNKTVKPKPIDQRPAGSTTISDELLASIKASYKIEGIYEYDGPGSEDGFVYREVPKGLWQNNWFNTGDLRGYNEDGEAVVDLEVTIRRTSDLAAAGFGAYVGLEGSVEVNAIP